MDELKEKLASLGLDEEQIAGSLEAFTDFLKSKVPDGMEGMLDSLLSGKAPEIGGDALEQVKGFFGR